MAKSTGRILKASDVVLKGQLTLSIMQSEPKQAQQTGTELVDPKVRIVESQPNFAVIEITCSCGTSMNLRCEYAGAQTPKVPESAKPEVQDNASESTDSKAQ